MREALDPLCADLQIAGEPQLHRTDALWHLSTPITGRLRETVNHALDLALALHPTPAVGGVPDRGGGRADRRTRGRPRLLRGRGRLVRRSAATAAGWCRSACAQLSADRRSAVAHSGGGIVAESEPDDEVDETTTKFRTILTGLEYVLTTHSTGGAG